MDGSRARIHVYALYVIPSTFPYVKSNGQLRIDIQSRNYVTKPSRIWLKDPIKKKGDAFSTKKTMQTHTHKHKLMQIMYSLIMIILYREK